MLTIEIVEELATEAEERLLGLGYTNIGIRVGDGGQGWPEHAPFDKILLVRLRNRAHLPWSRSCGREAGWCCRLEWRTTSG